MATLEQLRRLSAYYDVSIPPSGEGNGEDIEPTMANAPTRRRNRMRDLPSVQDAEAEQQPPNQPEQPEQPQQPEPQPQQPQPQQPQPQPQPSS